MSKPIQKPEEVICPDGDASYLVAQAPLPTKRTLRHRKSLFIQFFKFIGINLNIVRMVSKGH